MSCFHYQLLLQVEQGSFLVPTWMVKLGFLGGSAAKNPPVSPGDVDSISGLGRSPEGRNGNSFQYSWLGNPMDKAAWWATIHMAARVGRDLATKQQENMAKLGP